MLIQAAPYMPTATAPAAPATVTTSSPARPTAAPLPPGTTFTTHTATYRILESRVFNLAAIATTPAATPIYYAEYVVRRTYHNTPHTSRVLVCADATVVEWLAESVAILAATSMAGTSELTASGHVVDALA